MKGLKGEIDQRPRRFYTTVSVVQDGAGWGVTLDGKLLRTPNKNPLLLPTEKLARVIADEWQAQAERIDLLSMYNNRLANLAIDRAGGAREELASEVAAYARTDLTCHLADAPAELRRRQEAGWTPLRDWAEESLGVRLLPVEGIMARSQPPESIDALRLHALSLDDFRLAALSHATPLLGSAVLALAAEARQVTALEAFEISRIDEVFQASRWGEDAEAKARTERTRGEARALDLWFDALN